MNRPKISIVTANLNGGQYLEKTILSILNQNYPQLEYIIVDGGSTDNSQAIIDRYKHSLSYVLKEPDEGLYDALEKGFQRSTGEIMMWLNSDDLLHSDAFLNIADTFEKFKQVNWITGINTFFNTDDRLIGASKSKKWSKYDYYLGEYEWIQQESTVWRRELWNKAGGFVNKNYKLAGDLELWTRFFKYEKLHTCNFLIGGFRHRPGEQLSSKFMDLYKKEASYILQKELNALDEESKKKLKRIHLLQNIKNILKKTRLLENTRIINKIDAKILQLREMPKSIEFDIANNCWAFV